MDRKLSKNEEIRRLIGLGDSARSLLGNEVVSLKQRLDVPARVRDSLKEHPTGWLVGSMATGLATSLIFRRKAVVIEKKHRSLPLVLLGLTLTAIRPLAKVWLTDQVKAYLTGRPGSFQINRPPNETRPKTLFKNPIPCPHIRS